LVVVTDKEIKITQQIHFEFDKDVIRRESYPILDAVAEVLQSNQAMRIEVQGHTDNKGAAAYNLKLSDRRAASVRKYLVGKGVSSDRLVSHGYGLTRPLVPNDSEQNRALNRRVQFMRTEGPAP
jgi:outer membrane protein OmpA-like peptidoglycan-associated protein